MVGWVRPSGPDRHAAGVGRSGIVGPGRYERHVRPTRHSSVGEVTVAHAGVGTSPAVDVAAYVGVRTATAANRTAPNSTRADSTGANSTAPHSTDPTGTITADDGSPEDSTPAESTADSVDVPDGRSRRACCGSIALGDVHEHRGTHRPRGGRRRRSDQWTWKG